MDLRKLSDSDILALSNNNLKAMSDAGIKLLAASEQDEAPKRKGVGAALSKGLESLLSSGQTTLESPFGINRAAERSLERSQALDKKYEDQIGLDKLKEVYEKRGLISAGGELLRQVPLALAEQAPNIAASLGSARTGAMLGSSFGPYGTAIGAGLGALTPSALQLFGSNVERQAAEQKEAGTPTDINTGRALAATAIQAPLDVAATYIPLGGKIAGKIFGPEVEKLLARGVTNGANKLAEESFAKTLGKGLGVGALAEIPTEVLQQVAERAQAGLSLTSPEALKEYGETAYQVGLLAPIGGAGRFVDKSAAKSKVALEQKEKDNKLAQEQQAAAQELKLAQQAEEQQKQVQAQQLKTGDLFGEPIVIGGKGKKLVEGAVSPLTSKPELFETGLNEKNEPTYGVRQAVSETRTAAERDNQQKAQEEQNKELFAAHFDAKQKVERLEKELIAAAQKGDLDTITQIQPVLKQYRDQIKTLSEQIKKAAPIEERSDVQMSTYRGLLKKKMAELAKFAESNPEKVDKLVPEIKELQSKIDELSKTIAPSTSSLPVTPGSGTQFDMFEPEKLAADKKETIAKETEQMQQQQKDLFAQVESTKPKANEVVTDAYQQGLQELEDAYAAGAPERIINNLIDKLRESSLQKEASKARGVSGEELESQVQRVERIKRSLEEAKNQYNEAKSDEERAEALKNVGALQDRLATAQADRAQGRPEVAEKEAFGKQEEAKRDAVETVRQLLSGEYFNSKNVDVASSLKPQLENKIVDAGKAYGREAVNEINAVREQYKQTSLSTDDALKLATRLQARFTYLAKNPTYLAEKVRETNFKTFEDSLERIKKDFFKGESKVRRVTPVLKQERNPIEMLRKEQAKKKPNPRVVEGLKREIEAGKKEDARIAAEKEKAEIKEPEGVNPDQKELFASSELEPIATVRATPRNFAKLVETQSRRFKERLDVAELNAKEIIAKKDFVSPNAEKVKQLEALRLKIENERKKVPSVFEPTEADKKRLPAAKIKQEVERSKRKLENYKENLKNLEEQEKKLAEEIKGSENFDSLLDNLKQQREFVNDLIDPEEAVKNLQANAQDLFNQRTDLVKYIENVKKSIVKTQKLANTNPTKKEKIVVFKKQLEEAQKTLAKMDEGGVEARNRTFAEIDSLYERANKVLKANVEAEVAILNSLEKQYAKTQKTSPEAVSLASKLEEERKKTAVSTTKAAEYIEKNIAQKRKAEQKRAEATKALPSKRQEIIETNRKAPGEELNTTRKQIIEKRVPKTEAEKVNEARQAVAEGARQMQEIKKMQNTSLKLKEVRKVESKLKKDLASKVEQIEADTKKLVTLESKAKETGAKEDKQALDTLKKEINAKNLGEVVNTIEKNLKLLKGVGSDVEKALVVLGNKPEKNERKKPLKTGVSKVEKDFKEAIDSEKYAETGLDKDTYVDMVIDIRNGDVDFRIETNDSTAPPITKAEAEDVLSKIKMPKGLKVFVLDKIPAELKELFDSMGHKSNKIKGWVTAKGDVYIVAENHTSIPDLNETIAHELIGHVGVEALLGEKGMRSLVRKIVSQEGGILTLAKKLGVFNEVYGTYASAKRQGLSDFEAQSVAVREMIAHTAEKAPNRSMTQKLKDFIKLVVAHVRDGLRKLGVNLDISTSDVYKIIHKARTNFENITPGAFVNAEGAIRFNAVRPKANATFEGVLNSTNGVVAQQKSWGDKLKGFLVGFETAYIDRFAPVQKVLEPIKDSLKATQLMYYLRMHDQRMAFTSEVLSNGPIDLVPAKDGKGFIIESQKGTSFIDVVEALKPANVGDVNATNRVFTMYLLAKRAATVGLAKLNYSGKVTQEMLDNAIKTVNSDPATKAAFENAAAIYAKYNEGLINFAVKAGAINKTDAAAMLKNKNFVPFYRVKNDGSVLLEIGGAPAIKIGNLAEQPYLHELVGGDQPIFDVFTSALQNTSMLTDMALRNIATKNTANTLADLGLLKVGEGKKDNGIYKGGDNVKGPDIIRFKSNGENYYARVNSEAAGVPTELLVKGLEGINTSLPEIVKMLNVPSTILRKWVTRNPAYVLRQLVRDPLNGVITAGLDTTPIVSSMREVIKMVKGKSEGETLLQGRGILGGQVLTGTAEDQQAMLKSLLSGDKGWDYRMAQLDQLSIKGDAATRVVMYNNYIKQGLSEMEATLATLEAMNFSKRGISASLFQISTMVPFMNAQIQGLNVLWKSFNGKMPFDQKLKIKQKAIQRSLMLMGSTILYAAMMQDDEAYQNANDDEKYGNWFVYTPFSDEPVKVPIPFEVGLLFKAVPEALVNTTFGDAKARDTMAAIGKQAMNSLPNVFPQAIKPVLEASINYSFYTGRGIESDRLMQYEPGERYEDRTSEIAKFVGGTLNISPVKLEYLIKGYFGSIPLAVASMANPIIRSGEGGEKPESRGIVSSDTPLLGTFFQPVDAGGLINKAYKDMDEINAITQTYKKMVKENRTSEAEAYLDMNADVIGMGSMAGKFRKKMGDLTNFERAIRTDPDMSAGEKRKALDEIKQIKIETAKYFSSVRG